MLSLNPRSVRNVSVENKMPNVPFRSILNVRSLIFSFLLLAVTSLSSNGQTLPTISINDPSVIEGNGKTNWTLMTFTLTRSDTSTDAAVFVSTSDGTATAPADYIQESGTVGWAAGQTTTTITVEVYGDLKLEPDETFHLNLSNPVNATISRAQGTGTIINDDTLRQSPIFDFNGDSISDFGIFRPSNGQWWITQVSPNPSVFVTQFGVARDIITPADFTGDGKTDISVFRPSDGSWFVLRSEDNSYSAFTFGQNGDIPMPADFDSDGKADACVFRPSTGVWYILRSSDGGVTTTQFGTLGDKPVAADYDGDGKADIAIFRANGASGAEWWILNSSGGVTATRFGNSTDIPVPGDYTGDGKADCGFWRPSTGFWFVLKSEDFSYFAVPYGLSTDIPMPGDYDGDGIMDPGVFRPSNSTFYFWRSAYGIPQIQFGSSTDKPINSAFVR